MAAFGWDDSAVKKSAAVRSSAHKSTVSKRLHRGKNKHNASADSIDYELSSSDDE